MMNFTKTSDCMIYMIVLLLTTLLACSVSKADESDCLSKIIYAESRGESVEGAIAVGDAAKHRAANQNKPLCKITGVHTKPVPEILKPHFKALANSIIASKYSTVNGADSWTSRKKPDVPGNITRHIDNHTFYALTALPEKQVK